MPGLMRDPWVADAAAPEVCRRALSELLSLSGAGRVCPSDSLFAVVVWFYGHSYIHSARILSFYESGCARHRDSRGSSCPGSSQPRGWMSTDHPPPVKGELELGEWTMETSGLGQTGEGVNLEAVASSKGLGGHLATPGVRLGEGAVSLLWVEARDAGKHLAAPGCPSTQNFTAQYVHSAEVQKARLSLRSKRQIGDNQVKRQASILCKGPVVGGGIAEQELEKRPGGWRKGQHCGLRKAHSGGGTCVPAWLWGSGLWSGQRACFVCPLLLSHQFLQGP